MKFSRSKIKNIYVYFLIFICIYVEFGYAAVVGNYLSGTLRSLLLIITVLPSLFLFKTRQSSRSILLACYICFVIMLSFLRDSSPGDYLLIILPIVVGYIIATRIPFNIVVKSFTDIVYFLTLYSLIFYFLCAFVPSFTNLLPTIGYFQDSHCTLHDAIFTVVINGATIPRNFGITWEPGAFSILLGIASFCCIFLGDTISKKRLIVYSIGIITTFSTMGYALIAALYLSFLSGNKSSNKALIFIGIVLVFVTLQIPFMQELTFGKLQGLGDSTEDVNATTSARINAVIYPGIAFLQSPLLGVGYDHFKYINKYLCDSVATNTVVNWFAIFGVLLGIPFTYYYLKSIYSLLVKKIGLFYVFVILSAAVLMISTESLLRISLIYFIIFLGTLNSNSLKSNSRV